MNKIYTQSERFFDRAKFRDLFNFELGIPKRIKNKSAFQNSIFEKICFIEKALFPCLKNPRF